LIYCELLEEERIIKINENQTFHLLDSHPGIAKIPTDILGFCSQNKSEFTLSKSFFVSQFVVVVQTTSCCMIKRVKIKTEVSLRPPNQGTGSYPWLGITAQPRL